MKLLLTISTTSFVFSVALWVFWSFFTIQSVFVPNWMASMIYLPHAARVLCVVYFGWKAIPGLYLAELWGPILVAQEAYNIDLWIPSAISVLSVPFALIVLEYFGFPLGKTQDSPLNKRNYKHVGLITMISAFFNALFVNSYLFLVHQNFPQTDVDIIQVLRFFIGDMAGAAIVFMILAIFLKPIAVVKR